MSEGRSRQRRKGARALLPASWLRWLSGTVVRCGQECPRSLLLVAVILLAPALPAQDRDDEARFNEESMRFRTALYHDPLLDPPLESLVKLYLSAERTDELVALYRNHIAQYPEDPGAKTVLVRILRRVDRAGADTLVAEAVPQHPDYAPLQYVLFRFFEERGDARATEALSKAIDLEPNLARRNAWLEELLALSEGETARALAAGHLDKLLAAEKVDLPTLLSTARLAQRHRFWEQSLTALNRARLSSPDPDASVEIELMRAAALAQLSRRGEAERLLDALLAKLAPDHWRRRELLTLRLGVAATDEGRTAYLAALEAAHGKKPDSESAALDYAEALAASERRDEAAAVLVAASTRLPKSHLLESRALDLLEGGGNLEALADFLEDRLEAEPGRLDLRFRFVKAQYALGRDAAAEQDFRTLVAGLPPDEVSGRILELQRYLRGIDRTDAAAAYLEQYVRNHPARLDVARELAEILLSTRAVGAGETIGELVRSLRPEEAEAGNVLDFAEFLLDQGFAHPARLLVEAKLAVEPRQFDLGLKLVEILGRAGDAAAVRDRIASLREMTDTAPRYSQWLAASLAAHRHLETLPGFLESELNRYDFDDGLWPEEKVEKFLILCEAGKRDLPVARLAEGLRRQLSQSRLDAALRLRLRKVLVAVLETDPSTAPELEEQLRLLSTEDATHRADHDLRRALVYHRGERRDLARTLLASVDLADVVSAPLLREAADVLVEYDLLDAADTALETVTRLEPADLLSWERRLSVLAALGEEATLRAVIRTLKSGEKGLALRGRSLRSLDDHLEASYWRSAARLLESGDPAAVLPLLASIEQEEPSERARLWSEWTRARVLSRLGREAEAREAIKRLQDRASARSLTSLSFPDGLELSIPAAVRTWQGEAADLTGSEAPPSAEFLLANPVLRWIFELPEGAAIVRLGRNESHVLALDDLDWVHCLDATSGKLLWRGFFGLAGAGSRRGTPSRPAAFDEVEIPPRLAGGAEEGVRMARTPPSFVVSGGRFFLTRGGECVAHSVADGAILWSADLPEASPPKASTGVRPGGARPERLLEATSGRVVVFDPLSGELVGLEEESGKRLWHTRIGGVASSPDGESGAQPSALQAGLELSGGLGLAYGREAVVFDAANGEIVWRFHESGAARFPVILRPPREGDPEEPAATAWAEEAIYDFDATAGSGRLLARTFMEAPTALVGPAVFWAESRLAREEPAFAMLDEGWLWLMQDGKVRRVAGDLPVASSELPGEGALVGRAGDHLWFLSGGDLLHANFHRGRTTKLVLGDLGPAEERRAVVSGNQLLVRGSRSLTLVNALTGEVLGRAALPAALVDYLAATPTRTRPGEEPGQVWQGRLHHRPSGAPPLCLPVGDLLDEGRCLAVFGDRVVACLEAATGAATPPPPAPSPR